MKAILTVLLLLLGSQSFADTNDLGDPAHQWNNTIELDKVEFATYYGNTDGLKMAEVLGFTRNADCGKDLDRLNDLRLAGYQIAILKHARVEEQVAKGRTDIYEYKVQSSGFATNINKDVVGTMSCRQKGK